MKRYASLSLLMYCFLMALQPATMTAQRRLTYTGPEVFRSVQPYNFSLKPIAVVAQNISLPDKDLRPRIQQMGLTIRNQGSRGTCSVFALTFALEYMYTTRLGIPVNDLSEEYLNYASNQAVGNNGDGGFFHDLDKGYQQFGMAPENLLPYQSVQVSQVAQSIINEGKAWVRFKPVYIKSWDKNKGAGQSQLNQAIQYLDQDIPVAAGCWWYKSGQAQSQVIYGVDLMVAPPVSEKDYQQTGNSNPTGSMVDGHSVVLVGYKKHVAFPGGGYFIFRNSWGTGFGDNGYGYMPFAYILSYANDLMVYQTESVKSLALSPQAVFADDNQLDVLVADGSGHVKAGAWCPQMQDGAWRAWWGVLGGRGGASAPVSVVARSPGRLDAFVAGTDGKVYTAAWDKKVTNAHWRGWWKVQNGSIPVGGHISAVARDPNKLDIFIVSTDGGIYTAAWDAHVSNGQWRGWWRIGNLKAWPGSQVAVVSRDAGKLDIFVLGQDNKVYTAAWDAKVSNGQWRGWWPVQDGKGWKGSAIAAVSRDPNKLDIFVTGADKAIWTAAWDAHVSNGQWRGWWKIGNVTTGSGRSLSAVARDANKLDVFTVAANGSIMTAAWDAKVSNGQWRGWWPIQNGKAKDGGLVAVARHANQLDVFAIGLDQAVWTAAWNPAVSKGEWKGWWRINP